MSMGIVSLQLLETFSLSRLLENKAMEKFSMRVRNKNKYRLATTKVCKILEDESTFKS